MHVTNSDQYLNLKSKDIEELKLNSRLMKEVKFKNQKFSIIEMQEIFAKTYLVLQRSYPFFY